MSPVGILDFLALTGSATALIAVLFFGRGRLGRNTLTAFIILLCLAVVHGVLGFMERVGTSVLPGSVKDFLEVLWAVAWSLVPVSFIQTRSERVLRESGERYRGLVENSHAGISVVQDGKFVFVSERLAEIRGHTVDEMIGRSPLEFLLPEDVAIMERNMLLRSAGQPVEERYTVRALHADGSTRYLDIIWSRVTWCGKPASLGNIVDVTDQKIIEQALKESEERYKLLVEKSHAGVSLTQGGKLIYASPRLAKICGRSVEEMVGRSPLEFLHSEDAHLMERNMTNRPAGLPADDRYTVRVKRKDGTECYLDIIGSLITWDGKPTSLGNIVDVTDQKIIEQALQESEERFRTVFYANPECISLTSLEDGCFVDINDSFLKMLGLNREDAIGHTSLELGLWKDRHSREVFRDILKSQGFAESFEADFACAGGIVRPVLISGRVIRLQGEPLILAIVRDIMRLKQAETTVRRSLEEKETLLREIHHRVKNNLQVISGLLNLQARYINDEASRGVYKDSQNRVISMALIHEKLYQARDLSRINFGDYIRHLAQNLFVSYGMKGGKVGFVLDAEPTSMVVDTAIPCGLIVNELISNAIKHAFPGGRAGEIRVSFRKLNGEKTYELIVCDDGVGFPDGVDLYRSGSLGLKLVRILVEQLGGTLKVNNDGGVFFRIRFKEYREAGTVLM
ncbi:MAG: PAS domain S-box protein [bacterium]|nr:PAS domain S-box protein [bacterium]MDT8396536.1 PAS domain S-box protein [bacterium]